MLYNYFQFSTVIDLYTVAGNLLPIGNKLPATESQARPLAKLEPDEQIKVWQNVIERADAG
jgi:hypothetical protein